jgi:segregation and condensation protein A
VTSPLNFHLEHYDGPLDLLLDLIRKQQIDIRDIPISTITAQYLGYLDKAREMDMNLSAEFVFMAATLIHIKSRMLLPTDPALAKGDDPSDDPRAELVERLIEHEKFKNAAQMLREKRMIEENVWSNPQMQQFVAEDEDPGLAVNLFDLVKAFGEVIERVKARPIYEIEEETVNVADMVAHLGNLLRNTRRDKPLFILQVLEQQRTRRAMICLFLAVLEMVKMQAVEIVQKDLFGEIALRKHERFDAVFSSSEPMPAIEEEYK